MFTLPEDAAKPVTPADVRVENLGLRGEVVIPVPPPEVFG